MDRTTGVIPVVSETRFQHEDGNLVLRATRVRMKDELWDSRFHVRAAGGLLENLPIQCHAFGAPQLNRTTVQQVPG